MQGRADISVSRSVRNRQVIDYYQQSPLRIFLPNPRSAEVTEILLANTSGGLVGGDQLDINVKVNKKAKVIISSQAAEKAYRSAGVDIRIETNLVVERDAALRWLPQETILFNGVRLRRRTSVNVEKHGSALAGEMLVFGRTARGENFTYGLAHDEWRVRYAGKLVWADNLHLTGDIARQLHSPAGFNGSRAMATLVYAAEDAAERAAFAKSLIESDSCLSGVTTIGNALIARWLSRDAAVLRREYLKFVECFFASIDGQRTALPRVLAL